MTKKVLRRARRKRRVRKGSVTRVNQINIIAITVTKRTMTLTMTGSTHIHRVTQNERQQQERILWETYLQVMTVTVMRRVIVVIIVMMTRKGVARKCFYQMANSYLRKSTTVRSKSSNQTPIYGQSIAVVT